MNLANWLTQAAQAHPERPALIAAGRWGGAVPEVTTFGEIEARSARIAGGLAALGLGRGGRVLILAPPSPLLWETIAAVVRLGAAVVLFDPAQGWRRLPAVIALTAPDALLAAPALLALRPFVPALRAIPLAFAVDARRPRGVARLALEAEPAAPVDVDPDAAALVTFTGGSTEPGGPRGVRRTHGLLAAQHTAISRAFPALAGDIDLPAFPVLTLHNLAAGVPTVLLSSDRRTRAGWDPAAVLAAIDTWQVTTLAAGSADLGPLAEACREAGRRLSLRRIVTGGAPLSPRLLRRLREIAPEAEVWSAYGSSEAEPVAVIEAGEVLDTLADRIAAGAGAPLGHPVPEVQVAIQDAAGEPVRIGEVGEIWVSGPHVAQSYFRDPSADARHKRRAPDGMLWHRMGDLGYQDGRGRLWLAGRTHSVIHRAGRRVYPVPIEAAAETRPGIAAAALVAVPAWDAARGDEIVLAIEPERLGEGAGGKGPTRTAQGPVVDHRHHDVDLVTTVAAIPRDARLRARIDYPALRRLLMRRRWRRAWWAYFQERFPPLQNGLLIASYFSANYLLAQAATPPGRIDMSPWRFCAGAVVLLLMFFHLRVIDEHKDAARDRQAYPERVLSRGWITLGDLRRLGAAAVGLELVLGAALGPPVLLGVLAILAMSALIAREFGLADAFDRHRLGAALVHLLIMPLYGLFIYAVATGRPAWTAPPVVLAYAWVGYALALAYELSRKTRIPEDERPGLITYSERMGPFRPAWIALAAVAAAGLISVAVGARLGFGPLYRLAVLGLVTVFAIGVVHYRIHPRASTAGRLKGYAGFFIIAFDLLVTLALVGW